VSQARPSERYPFAKVTVTVSISALVRRCAVHTSSKAERHEV
jgi:hypothetical protein